MAFRGPPPDASWAELSAVQKRVVKYMHENNASPWDAVAAGMCSRSSVEKWTVKKLNAWLATYRRQLPPTPQELAELARGQLRSMLGDSLGVIHNTLVTGEGDATAVKTARWIIDGIIAEAKAIPDAQPQDGFETSGVAELAAVLQLVGQ